MLLENGVVDGEAGLAQLRAKWFVAQLLTRHTLRLSTLQYLVCIVLGGWQKVTRQKVLRLDALSDHYKFATAPYSGITRTNSNIASNFALGYTDYNSKNSATRRFWHVPARKTPRLHQLEVIY